MSSLEPAFRYRLSDAHVHALAHGAVVTAPFRTRDGDHRKLGLIPGSVISLPMQNSDAMVVCRILDVESVKPSAGSDEYSIRVTLIRATEA